MQSPAGVLAAMQAQLASQAAQLGMQHALLGDSSLASPALRGPVGVPPPPAVGSTAAAVELLGGLLQPQAAAAAAAAAAQQQAAISSAISAVAAAAQQQQQQASRPGDGQPSQEAGSRVQKMKEERLRKEAEDKEDAERRRCHLHKKPNKNCKFCQRHQEFVSKREEDKAAMRKKFIDDVRNGGRDPKNSGPGNKHGPLELVNSKTFGFPPLLQSHVVECAHFKTLMTLDSIEQIVQEICSFVDSIEPYVQNSTTVPTALLCCVYRLLVLGLDGQSLRGILESDESPYVRCAGFLVVRFGLVPEQLWPWLGEYVLDDEEIWPSKDAEAAITVGEYVESLLTQERYYNVVMPRFPVSTKRKLEEKLAQVPQFRKRTQANLRIADGFREPRVHIEACLADGTWHRGETIEMLEGTKLPKVRVRLENGNEEVVHLGKVILADARAAAAARGRASATSRRQRSRSRSPTNVDWSVEKGKSCAELLEELRKREQDRAVCTSGKEYAKRPVSFKVALPMEQGSASHRLIQDETYVPTSSKRGDYRERSRSPELRSRDKEHSVEYQARMKALFEKYGMAKSSEEGRNRNDIEGPDKLRLG